MGSFWVKKCRDHLVLVGSLVRLHEMGTERLWIVASALSHLACFGSWHLLFLVVGRGPRRLCYLDAPFLDIKIPTLLHLSVLRRVVTL